MGDIKVISRDEANEIMYDFLVHPEEYRDKGLYMWEEPETETFVGIDNSTGNMWVETWPNREQCEAWLRGEIDARPDDAS
jgi:hypothetical protein